MFNVIFNSSIHYSFCALNCRFDNFHLIIWLFVWKWRSNMHDIRAALHGFIPSLIFEKISLDKCKRIFFLTSNIKDGLNFFFILKRPNSPPDMISMVKQNLNNMTSQIATNPRNKDLSNHT